VIGVAEDGSVARLRLHDVYTSVAVATKGAELELGQVVGVYLVTGSALLDYHFTLSPFKPEC
jgi:hypothetical protein